ncbi:hypothetical protein DAMA08_036680 [Martiniozyma asiatica (nom. inval.)]|nr:hypothetical protein DAMA08_036680 [Martiniozyma asiatica]
MTTSFPINRSDSHQVNKHLNLIFTSLTKKKTLPILQSIYSWYVDLNERHYLVLSETESETESECDSDDIFHDALNSMHHIKPLNFEFELFERGDIKSNAKLNTKPVYGKEIAAELTKAFKHFAPWETKLLRRFISIPILATEGSENNRKFIPMLDKFEIRYLRDAFKLARKTVGIVHVQRIEKMFNASELKKENMSTAVVKKVKKEEVEEFNTSSCDAITPKETSEIVNLSMSLEENSVLTIINNRRLSETSELIERLNTTLHKMKV